MENNEFTRRFDRDRPLVLDMHNIREVRTKSKRTAVEFPEMHELRGHFPEFIRKPPLQDRRGVLDMLVRLHGPKIKLFTFCWSQKLIRLQPTNVNPAIST